MKTAHRGKKHSVEAKRKMSAAHRGKRLSFAHRERLSIAGRGRIHTAAARQNMSAAQRGKSVSIEARENMRNAKLGKPGIKLSQEQKDARSARLRNNVTYKVRDPNGNIHIVENQKEFALLHGFDIPMLRKFIHKTPVKVRDKYYVKKSYHGWTLVD